MCSKIWEKIIWYFSYKKVTDGILIVSGTKGNILKHNDFKTDWGNGE